MVVNEEDEEREQGGEVRSRGANKRQWSPQGLQKSKSSYKKLHIVGLKYIKTNI